MMPIWKSDASSFFVVRSNQNGTAFFPPTHTICLLRLPISCKFKVAHAFKWTCHAIFIWVSGCRAVGFPNTKSFACTTKWGINLPLSACCLSASTQKEHSVRYIGNHINSWTAVLTIYKNTDRCIDDSLYKTAHVRLKIVWQVTVCIQRTGYTAKYAKTGAKTVQATDTKLITIIITKVLMCNRWYFVLKDMGLLQLHFST